MSDSCKHCSVCKELKPFSEFYKAKKDRTGFGNRCKGCEREYAHSRKEQKQAYMREYVQSIAYKNRRAEKRREATLQRMQHKIIALQELADPKLRQWRMNAASRFEAKLKATPVWVSEEQKTRTMQIYAATQQMQELTASVYHVDHIVPLRNDLVCGLHVWWNLQPLPEYENLAKRNTFDPSIFPNQGELAFPDGAGPTIARIAMPFEKVENHDE